VVDVRILTPHLTASYPRSKLRIMKFAFSIQSSTTLAPTPHGHLNALYLAGIVTEHTHPDIAAAIVSREGWGSRFVEAIRSEQAAREYEARTGLPF
jgi:hypothetical protein